MHASTLFALGSTLLTLASALPPMERTPTELAPRCGTTVYPQLITWLDSLNPTSSFGAQYAISAISGSSTGTNRVRLTGVQFAIPAGARGACSLRVRGPSEAVISRTGKYLNQLQVTKAAGKFSFTDTFNSRPAAQSGSFGPLLLGPGDREVNSEGCQETLGYYIQTFEPWQTNAADQPNASVQFDQMNGVYGLYMTFGC